MSGFWQRTRPLRVRLGLLLAILGPGIITANVDNDAGGIATYSMAGARYGYGFLWMLPLVVIALIIVQEMSARLGVITGKGLADLMRESLGIRTTAFVLILLLVVNLANTISEFAGVAAALGIFGVSKFISVPIAAVLVWLLIVKGNYRTIERIFLFASAIYLCYVISGVLAKPDWAEVGKAMITPTFRFDGEYIVLFVTIIGTTIAPWMQFYQQSSIVDKGIKPSDYKLEKLDVIIGSIFAVVVAGFIVISCAATIFQANFDPATGMGLQITDAAEAAAALAPLAGGFAAVLFALGLLNASLFSAAILPLSTSYTVCEAFGWESGVSRKWREAPIFFIIYTVFIIVGAIVVLLIPIDQLIPAMLLSQTLNGILLPIVLLMMLKLINDARLMGRFKNGLIMNIITWIVVLILIILTVIMLVSTFFPGLFVSIGLV